MSMAAELNSQIASIVEVLANSAVAEICKVVEDGYAVVNLEMSQSLKENECLRRRVRLLELQVSRYRAEQRLKPPLEGAVSGRVFPGVRLLHHRTGRDTPTGRGASLHSRGRFLNRSSGSQPPKPPPTDVDQDPDQDVVTTTKTEPTESEEDSDLIIVKVEGSVSVENPSISNNNNSNRSTSTACTSDTQAQTGCQTEVSGSQTFNETQDDTLSLSPSQQTQIHVKNSDVIVIDNDGEKELASNQKNYAVKTWHSVTETVGTSCSLANSFVTDSIALPKQLSLNLQPNVTVSNQRFETLNTSQNVAHFSGVTNQSSTTNHSASQGNLNGHIFSQGSQAKPFSCSKCPMRFSLEAELVKHVAGHKRRKYICGLCGKDFVSKSKLEIHRNVHTGERPFKCTVCNSCFSNPSNVRRHMRLQHQHAIN